MKKIYLSFAAIIAATAVNAQINSNHLPVGKYKALDQAGKTTANVNAPKGAVLWSNDFSSAADWTMTNTSAPFYDWEITTDVNAIPVSALAPAGHTSAANGYAFINSDAQGETANQNADLTTAAPITACATSPNVSLVFEQSYRIYQDTRIVRVSNDGTTWTDYVVTDGTNSNTNTANPELYSIDISAVAGNQAQVWIQFNYQGNWGWFWAVDDVRIVETDPYDLKAEGIHFGVEASWGTRLPYYQTPVGQVAPIEIGGIAKNIGVNDVADLTFTATIPSTYSGTTTGNALTASTVDTFDVTTPFTPAASVASYAMDFAVATPGNVELDLTNNVYGQLNLDVTNFIYARDKGTIEGGSYNAGDEFEVGNIFDMITADDIYAVNVTLATTAVVDAQMFAKLYSIDPSTGDFLYVDESNAHVITSAELGTEVILPFIAGPHTLNAGESYLVVVGSYGDGGASNDLVVATSGVSEAQTTFYYDGTDATWYYTTSTPMVRMNFDPSSNVSELNALEGVRVYPNPSEGIVNISNDNNNDNTITVFDLTGKEVASKSVSTATTIDLSSIGTGVYLVEVANANGKSVERIVIR